VTPVPVITTSFVVGGAHEVQRLREQPLLSLTDTGGVEIVRVSRLKKFLVGKKGQEKKRKGRFSERQAGRRTGEGATERTHGEAKSEGGGGKTKGESTLVKNSLK